MSGTGSGDGWARIPWGVIDQMRTLGHAATVTYLAIVRHANKRGRSWPSLTRLAGVTGLSRRSVIRSIKTLTEAGLLVTIARRSDAGSHSSNEYRLAQGVVTRVSLPSDTRAPRGGDTSVTGVVTPEHLEPEPIEQEPIEPAARRKAAAVVGLIPDSLNTPEFRAAWQDWEQHRREIKKPLKPTSTRHQLDELVSMGPAGAIAAIRHSIAKGWQGIFPPTTQPANKPTAKPSPPPPRASLPAKRIAK